MYEIMTLRLTDGKVAKICYDDMTETELRDLRENIESAGWRTIAWIDLECGLETERAQDLDEALATLWCGECPELFEEEQDSLSHLPEATQEMLYNAPLPGVLAMLAMNRSYNEPQFRLTTNGDDACALMHLTPKHLAQENWEPENALSHLEGSLKTMNAVARGDVYCISIFSADGEDEDEDDCEAPEPEECYGGIICEDYDPTDDVKEHLEYMGYQVLEETK